MTRIFIIAVKKGVYAYVKKVQSVVEVLCTINEFTTNSLEKTHKKFTVSFVSTETMSNCTATSLHVHGKQRTSIKQTTEINEIESCQQNIIPNRLLLMTRTLDNTKLALTRTKIPLDFPWICIILLL